MFGPRLSRRPGEILTRFATSKNENFIDVGHFSISFMYLNIRLVLSTSNALRRSYASREIVCEEWALGSHFNA